MTDHAERMQILKTAFCEAHRPGEQRLPPGLVMAVMDVESRFNRWAVSSAGAVGLMQVMPFWPEELGMKRHQLTQVEANMRMGCAILRHYLQREKQRRAQGAGALQRQRRPARISRPGRATAGRARWNGADDLGTFRAAPSR